MSDVNNNTHRGNGNENRGRTSSFGGNGERKFDRKPGFGGNNAQKGERSPHVGGTRPASRGEKSAPGGEKSRFDGEKRRMSGDKPAFRGEKPSFGGKHGQNYSDFGDRGKGRPMGDRKPVQGKTLKPHQQEGLPARRLALEVIREVTEK